MAYDPSVRMYDEPHTPDELRAKKHRAAVYEGRLLSPAHTESYLYQLRMIQSLKPVRLLEVGPGDSVIGFVIGQLGVVYHSLDIIKDRGATYEGRLEDFDPTCIDEPYDVVCAFQMLEHSPYERFTENVRKLAALSRRYVFISVPYSCKGFRIKALWHRGQNDDASKHWRFFWESGLPNRRYRPEFMEEFPWAVHYWEMGRKAFPRSRVVADIEAAGLKLVRQVHGENPFHYFFLAEKA